MTSFNALVLSAVLLASSAFAQDTRELKTVIGTDGRAIRCSSQILGARGFIVSSAKVMTLASGNLKLDVQVQAVDCRLNKDGKAGFVAVDLTDKATATTPGPEKQKIVVETVFKENELVLINDNYEVLSVEKFGNGKASFEIAKPAVGFVDLFVRGTQTTTAEAVNYSMTESYASGLIRLVLK